MKTDAQLSSHNWFGRASAGLVLGFLLALAGSGLLAWFGPGGIAPNAAKTQFIMWIIAPIWSTVLSLSFLFRTGRSAWIKLGLTTLLAFAALYAGRWLLP